MIASNKDAIAYLERRAKECREDFKGLNPGTEHRKGDQYYLGMAAAFTEACSCLARTPTVPCTKQT